LLTIRENGVLRVGYNPEAPPFSYFNDQGDLVGFDISLAYQLARDLGVRLEFVPFDWQSLERDLREHRFDVAMSGIYETDDRLQAVAVTHPYYQSAIALIVQSDQAKRFVDRRRIMAIPNLRLAVRGDPVLMPMVHFLFPKASVSVVPRDAVEAALKSGQVEGVVSSMIEARLWAASHPGFTAVAPTAARGPILFTYLVPPGGDSFRRYLDQWLDIKSADGFRTTQVDYWMNQTPRADSPRRWNLVDALSGQSP
jgi:ABC-type amino acid transport substrate-binding protein